MKPAIVPEDVAALSDTPLASELEAMDAEIIPIIEQRLFTFDKYQHLNQDWKPSNSFEQWVDTKLYIRSEVTLIEGKYNITLKYVNGFLGAAIVVVDGISHYYTQMEMGWTRQYSKLLENQHVAGC